MHCLQHHPLPYFRQFIRRITSLSASVLLVSLLPMFLHGAEAIRYDVFQEDDPDSTDIERGSPGNCYNENGLPQRCIPEFSNTAFGMKIEATNTCGRKMPQEFCRQKSSPGVRTTCEMCEMKSPSRAHPPSHMTDFDTQENLTWWMSETMEEGIQHPNQVNLTLDLGKSFDISYVRLKFYSSRPESFAIYKRTSADDAWTPYQYYSASCSKTYGLEERTYVTRDNETTPLCTTEYSDISPLTGGSVAFSTLEGRPSAYDFENSPELQEWVIATGIRISLDRLNTFGDEIYEDPLVLKSYYYAISDFAVGARCRCHGHASDCISIKEDEGEMHLVCRCEHHTMGSDCEECLPLYNNRLWAAATPEDANECLPCNCNGKSNKCFFDQELYNRTGHGGHCVDCEDNTEGTHCERCKSLHYRRRDDQECFPCNCNAMGSLRAQCHENGQCPCKPGVGRRTCDKCAPNFYDMTRSGCRPCGCNLAGIAQNGPTCDPSLGACPCKEHVEGQNCDRCSRGFFDLQLENEFGCVQCFCYGHSNECQSASGFYKKIIETTFDEETEGWTATDLRGRSLPVVYDADLQIIQVRGQGRDFVYFLAPECYLGNQRASYNHYLNFTLRIGADSVRVSAHDVILEGAGLRVSVPISDQGNPVPSHRIQDYKFRLHEHPDFGWTPRVNAFDFMKILSNLTAMKIKATYSKDGIGYLDNVILESALTVPGNYQATWIEQCACPEGYRGLSCESCAPGYRRDPLGNNLYSPCVRCFCNSHADNCDPETGQCVCKHNTEGNYCERCATGYSGNPRKGTSGDCKPCLCPDRGSCVILPGGHVACQQCPMGHTGHQCDLCIDGYFGDPLGRSGPPRQCQKCECNDNIDPNAVGNCNTTTGECLKCIYNTEGWNCEKCLPLYYGDPLGLPKSGCKRCTCYLPGTIQSDRHTNPCEPKSGQCRCKSNVVGRRCENCRRGFWNIDNNDGCEKCNCDRIGSVNQTCDSRSGQCHCRPGVTGRHCDMCAAYYYGFSEEGCSACDCDATGAVSLQCDTIGQCQCRPNREGRRCTVCKENKYSRGTVCIDCPPCYNLLEEAIDRYKEKLTELARLLQAIQIHPETVQDLDFQRKLREAVRKIDELFEDARRAAVADGNLISQLNDLRKRIQQIQDTAGKVSEKMSEGDSHRLDGLRNITLAESVIREAQDALTSAKNYLDIQGADAYNSALERSKLRGQQSKRLSEISREARQLADQQEADAEVMMRSSDEALNASTEAYRLARDTFESQQRLSSDVYGLNKKLDELTDFMQRTKRLANDAKTEAGSSYEDALDIYTDANSILVPVADVQGSKDEAARIKTEAMRIKNEADGLANEHKELLSDIDEHTKDAYELLAEAIRQQQITDELLTDTDAALSKSEDAIASGEKILDDARHTLETLKGFDQQVKESQGRADEALKKIPQIERMIREAEEKTYQAEDALGGAFQDAADARNIAKDAKIIAEQASKDADGIRKEADETKSKAGKLRGQADDLSEQILDTDKRIRVFEDEAKTDGEMSKEALERANEAKTAAIDASDKAREATEKLDDILDTLGDLDSVDNFQLDELENLLETAERELRDADLNTRAQILREAKEEQHKWMSDYEDEIDQLKKDVANVAAIRRSLPDDCYRRLVLEP